MADPLRSADVVALGGARAGVERLLQRGPCRGIGAGAGQPCPFSRSGSKPGGGGLTHWLGEWLIYGPIRDQLGLGRVKRAYTAGEAIGEDVFLWFRAIGLNLRQFYGQTENCALAVAQKPDDPEGLALLAMHEMRTGNMAAARAAQGRAQAVQVFCGHVPQLNTPLSFTARCSGTCPGRVVPLAGTAALFLIGGLYSFIGTIDLSA